MLETYVATDIETDGPVPGLYSMLSLASAAFSEKGELLATFTANLVELPDASRHPDNMRCGKPSPRRGKHRATAPEILRP